jgi:hypothetical protein
MNVRFSKKNRGGNSKISTFEFSNLKKNHIPIIIGKREERKYFWYSANILALNNFTDHLNFLEPNGISGDAALLTLAWACYRGMEE